MRRAFDSLATFYRKGWLRIDATKRRPEVRAERIAEIVALSRWATSSIRGAADGGHGYVPLRWDRRTRPDQAPGTFPPHRAPRRDR
ncbi:MAG TPA: YdeI/OmpD-associated family protein [Candidatus Dormibacteraeota bacterium]